MLDLKHMLGRLYQRSPRLTAIGAVLCVLAAMFAIEAKVAWYSPAGSPSSQISAAKLQPAEAPRQIAQAIGSPAPVQPFFPEVGLLLAAAALLVAFRLSSRVLTRETFHNPAFAGCSLSLFRRPPPQF